MTDLIQILYNLSILITISVISGFIYNKFNRESITGKILQGLVFGLAAIIGMMYPFKLADGLIFDGRSVVLSICSLFFGPVPGIIAGLMTVSYRAFVIGGVGAIMGVSVISESVIMGLIFYYWLKFSNRKKTIPILYLMGIIVHIVMLLLMAFLPSIFVWDTYRTIGLTVIVFYPLATILIGKILIDQDDNIRLFKELASSEEKYKLIAENSADPIIMLDLNFKHLFVSPSVFALYGYTSEEYAKLTMEETITPESQQRITNLIVDELKAIKESGYDKHKKIVIELEEYKKDGSTINVESTIKFVFNEIGKPLGIVFASRDITERKRAQLMLSEAKATLDDVINTQPAGIYRIKVIANETFPDKMPMFSYDFLSTRYCDMLGYDADYLYNEPYTTLKLLHPEDYEAFITANAEADRTGSRFIWEGRMILKGQTRWIRYESIPRVIDEFQIIWTGALIDITDSKAKEKEIFEREETFRRLFEDSTDPIILFDDVFFDCNNSALLILGYTDKAELIGKKAADISPEYQDDNCKSLEKAARMVEIAKENGHNRFEWIHNKANGEEFYVEVMLTPILLKGKLIYHVMWRDISERKKSEEIIRKTTEEMQSIIRYNPLSIQIADSNGYTEEVNTSFMKLFGVLPPKNYTIFDDLLLKKQNLDGFMNKIKEGEIVFFPDFYHNPSEISPELPDLNVWVRMVVFSLKDKNGKPEKYVLMHEDITEWKKAQNALVQSERNYREIFNATTDAIFIHDSDTGEILDVNDSMLKMYGYADKSELLGIITENLSAKDEGYTQKKAESIFSDAKQKNKLSIEWRAKRKNGEVFWAEVTLQNTTIGGEGRTLAVVRDITERKRLEESLQKRIIALTQPLDVSESIDFAELFGIDEIQSIQDAFADLAGVGSIITYPNGKPITKPSNFCQVCKIIMNTTVGANHCFKLDTFSNSETDTFNCTKMGVYKANASIIVGGKHIANWLISQISEERFDINELVKYAESIGADFSKINQALLQVSSMSKERFDQISKSLNSFANEISTKAYQNILQARFIADRQKAQEEVLRLNAELEDKVNQRTMELQVAMEELQDSNAELQTMNEQMVETSNKMVLLNEELNEALATKDRFFSIIAHDLRNPFVVLLNNSEMLQNYYDRLDDKAKMKKINDIKEASNNTYNLLENLLTWARAQKGNINFSPNIYNAYDLLYKNFLVLKSQTLSKNIKVDINCTPDATIYCDRDMIDTILRNLLSNSIKFTNVGGNIEIGIVEEIETLPSVIIDNFVKYDYLYVKDNGIGMNEEMLSNIFRIDQKYSRKGTGGEASTGLGLLICKEFIEKHEGKIWVDSNENIGTIFYFCLPKKVI